MPPDDRHGLEEVNYIYANREAVGKDIKASGKKMIGYLCYFAPPEMVCAAGMVPFRITGRMGDEITESDDFIEPLGCPYIRNCFEQDLKGRLDFLEGRIVPHSCDSAQRIYGIWKHYKEPAYSYLFNVPHMVTPWSVRFFQRELGFFKESLEKFAGRRISEKQLEEAVTLYNDNRRMIEDLYELRKQDPPALSGTEMFKLLVAGMTIPPEAFNALLKEVKKEVQERPKPDEHLPRIMFWGCIIDDARLFQLIEQAGCVIVTDDTCIGTRSYLRQVDTSRGVMEGLTKVYFEEFKCPRTDRGPGPERFDYVVDMVRTYNVQGVIGYMLSFCDPHKLDYPDLRDYLDKKGIPLLLIDDDYTLSNAETIRSRIEAFLEMI